MRTFEKSALVLAATIVAFVPGPAASQTARDWKEIKKPELKSFVTQQPRRIELPNGMIIFLQEDHELPLIRGSVIVRGGSREEPADKLGLTSIYGQVWRTGGTASKSGDELDDYLEARAAKVETSADDDSSAVSWDSLKDDFDDVFRVVVDLLRAPAFREEKIGLAKNQLNTGIARRNDDVDEIAGREATKLVYGASSPYARVPEYASVAAVTREDLIAWHKSYVHPNNMFVGISGDFDAKKMEAILRKSFGSWPTGPKAKQLEIPVVRGKPGVYFIEKDDVTQSEIRIVHLGTTKDNPDYIALQVMNELFGGGMSSRLFSNVRSKQGLAYSVGGGVGTAYDHPGMFQLSASTKSGSTLQAVKSLHGEIDSLQKNPIETPELVRAKESILNSFIFLVDSKQKVLTQKILLEFYGYPADFLDRYRAGVDTVSSADISRVANKYINRGDVAVLVVGKESDLDGKLADLGPVTKIDITIPEPGSKEKVAPASSNPEGRALASKVVDRLGGKTRIAAIKSLRRVASATTKTPQGEMSLEIDSIAVYPDRSRQVMKTPMGEITIVATPATAFMLGPMGTRDLPSSQKEDSIRDLKRDVISIAQHADDAAWSFTAGAVEEINGVSTRILDIHADGVDVRWFVDPEGRVVRTSATATVMGSPSQRIADLSDFRTVDGVTLPFKQVTTVNGERFGSAEIKEIVINPPVDETLFVKPPAN